MLQAWRGHAVSARMSALASLAAVAAEETAADQAAAVAAAEAAASAAVPAPAPELPTATLLQRLPSVASAPAPAASVMSPVASALLLGLRQLSDQAHKRPAASAAAPAPAAFGDVFAALRSQKAAARSAASAAAAAAAANPLRAALDTLGPRRASATGPLSAYGTLAGVRGGGGAESAASARSGALGARLAPPLCATPAGAPATSPPGEWVEAQSARIDMQRVMWPGLPQPRRAAARAGDPGSGESALVEMAQVEWPAPRMPTAASNSLPIGDPVLRHILPPTPGALSAGGGGSAAAAAAANAAAAVATAAMGGDWARLSARLALLGQQPREQSGETDSANASGSCEGDAGARRRRGPLPGAGGAPKAWGTPPADAPHPWARELISKRSLSHPGAVPTAKRPRSGPRVSTQTAQAAAPIQAATPEPARVQPETPSPAAPAPALRAAATAAPPAAAPPLRRGRNASAAAAGAALETLAEAGDAAERGAGGDGGVADAGLRAIMDVALAEQEGAAIEKAAAAAGAAAAAAVAAAEDDGGGAEPRTQSEGEGLEGGERLTEEEKRERRRRSNRVSARRARQRKAMDLAALQQLVAEMAQESRQLRQRVADLAATNSVLVASIPNLSQRHKEAMAENEALRAEVRRLRAAPCQFAGPTGMLRPI
ncbi:hypothetical protein WJX81_005927 [Elliptochloris bilobata]|uniref:BZIP domain-containing protein n=1 Tax=Elliptochloris bilobata TaxID=381761 RepID=A0AAW1QV94_9CHLO